MKLHYWIDRLEESNSRLHKESVIEDVFSRSLVGCPASKMFLTLTKWALDPLITFGVKKIPLSHGLPIEEESDWRGFVDLIMNLSDRHITGHAARDKIIEVMGRFDPEEWNKVARRVLLKDLRCGATATTFNKIVKGSEYEIPVFSVQLAHDSKSNPKKMTGRKRLEVKLDGVRCVARVRPFDPSSTDLTVELFSRNGRVLENFPNVEYAIMSHIVPRVANLAPAIASEGFFLDGEVMSASFQDLMKQVHRKKNASTTDCVFHVFDIFPEETLKSGKFSMAQEDRTKLLGKILPENYNCKELKFMPGITVDLSSADGQGTMERFAKEALAMRYEGILVKDLEAPYECKRSAAWLKWKPTITVDLTIVGYKEGTGKDKGKLGSFQMKGVDAGREIEVSVGGGYSDGQRREYWKYREECIGQIAEVEADGVTQNQDGTYSLRFPRFVRFRGFLPGEKL